METNQVSFPERGGMVCWVTVRKERTFQAVRQRQGLVGAVNHRVIFLGECGDCLINPSFCSIFQ